MADRTFGIKLRADASGFAGQVGDAKRSVEDFGKAADETSITMATRFGTAIGAAAVAVGGVFVNEVRKAVNALDDLDETATALGIAADKLSSMQISARAAGVETNQFNTAITRLNAQIADAAAGNERATRLFQAMGVAVRDARGELRSADEVLGDIADRFSGYADGAKKSNLATDLFGRGATKMVTYLNEGREALTKFTGASQEQITEAAKLAGEIDKLSASWERLKLAVGGTVAGGVNRVIAAAGSESENAADKVLQRLEQSIERMRRQLGGRLNDELRLALQSELDEAVARAQALRSQIEAAGLSRFVAGGNALRGANQRPEAPNPNGTPRERAGRSERDMEEERLQRELLRMRQQGYQQAIKDAEARERELAQMDAQNDKIREQIQEYGKTEMQIAELRAARLEEAAAQKEQRLAQLELVDGNEAEVLQLREQIRLLRERAQLTRAAGGQQQLGRQEREGSDAARRALQAYEQEQARVADEWRRDLTQATQRGLEAGKGFFGSFAESLANTVRARLSAAIADAIVQLGLRELAGGSGSSGWLDSIGSWYVNTFGAHAGGVVGEGGTFSRGVPAGVFVGARRYHGGGMVLGKDEVPIIARKGERVLTEEQQRGMGGVTINVINQTDARVRVQESSSGQNSFDVIIEQMDAALATRVNSGRGELGAALANRFGLNVRPQGA